MNEHMLVCVAWPYAKSSTHVGQIVGAYVQDEGGRIQLRVAADRDPGPAGRSALHMEGQRLGDWLDGEKVTTLYKSPLVTWDG